MTGLLVSLYQLGDGLLLFDPRVSFQLIHNSHLFSLQISGDSVGVHRSHAGTDCAATLMASSMPIFCEGTTTTRRRKCLLGRGDWGMANDNIAVWKLITIDNSSNSSGHNDFSVLVWVSSKF